MIRATTLFDIRALLGQMLDLEDLDLVVNDSIFQIAYRPLSDICRIEITPLQVRREAFEGPKVLVKMRPGEMLREDVGATLANEQAIIRVCEVWARRVTKERDALEAMRPLLETQRREADCYARLAEFPDRMRSPEEVSDFYDRLRDLEERLNAHLAETVPDPEALAAQAEVVHAEIQKLERRSAVVGIRRSLAMVWAFIMTLVTDGTKVAAFFEAVEKLRKFLPP